MEIKSEVKNQINYVRFPKMLDSSLEKNLEESMTLWKDLPVKLHVFDFCEVLKLATTLNRHFINFQKELKRQSQIFVTSNISKILRREINDQGLTSVYSPVNSLREAKLKAGIPVENNSKSIDAKFLNPFIYATKETLEMQANLEVVPGKPFAEKERASTYPMDIAGVININSVQFVGNIAICFSSKVFLSIYEKMLDETHEEIDDEVKDAAGELLNIIYGQAKTTLNKQGYDFTKSIPAILVGKNLEVQFKTYGPVIVLPFETNVGSFEIKIVLDQSD